MTFKKNTAIGLALGLSLGLGLKTLGGAPLFHSSTTTRAPAAELTSVEKAKNWLDDLDRRECSHDESLLMDYWALDNFLDSGEYLARPSTEMKMLEPDTSPDKSGSKRTAMESECKSIFGLTPMSTGKGPQKLKKGKLDSYTVGFFERTFGKLTIVRMTYMKAPSDESAKWKADWALMEFEGEQALIAARKLWKYGIRIESYELSKLPAAVQDTAGSAGARETETDSDHPGDYTFTLKARTSMKYLRLIDLSARDQVLAHPENASAEDVLALAKKLEAQPGQEIFREFSFASLFEEIRRFVSR